MNRHFYKILFIFSLIIISEKKLYSQNPAACNNTQNLCTNALFSFSASAGTGLPAGLNISNPIGNPQAVNAGCMFTNGVNPQWLLLNVTTSGNLGFSFGAFGSAFPQAGNYDWIMWPYTPSTCADIFNNTIPPVACNWNCSGGGGTGMGTVPVGGSPCNFQPSIPVVQGQQFLILITNPSGVNTNVSFAITGSAAVSCNPLKYPNLTACPGQLAVFTGTYVNASAATYTLYPGAIVQTSPSFTVSSLVNQVYTVQAQGLNSSAIPIADQTTFTLTINPVIPITITTPTNFCYGSNANFTINPTGAGSFSVTGPASPTSTFATTSISIPNITTPNIGTFSVIANYTNGCIGTQTTQVNVAPNNSITVSSNMHVCMNGTVNLTSSMPTATAYAWTGPGAYSSGIQNPTLPAIQPASSGIYTVSSNINFNGITCPKTNTTQVSVVTTNTVAITPNFTLCQGASLNLTSSAAPAFSYSWSGPSSYTSSSQNPNIPNMFPNGSGNYSVTASFSLGPLTCTTGAVSNVSIVATSPVTVALPNNICQNATANLTVTTSHAPLSYLWSGPNSFTSNLVNPSITNIQPIASGVYSTIATYAIGSVSCTTTGTNQISVVPTSTIATTPNFTLCQGSNLNLNSLASGAVSYSWTGPPTYTSSAQNPVVPSMLPTGSGNYSVTASFSLGPLTCTTGAVSNVSIVATSPVTVALPNNICQNATANLTVTTSPAPLSYLWSGPNSFTSNLVNPSITNIQPIASGVYSTIATYAIGSVSCTTTGTNQISVVPTSTVAVTPNFTLCQGSSLNLTASAPPAFSYSWTGPPTYTSGTQNPVVPSMLPTGSGNYSVTASFSLGPLTCTTGAVSNVSIVATSPVTVALPNNICQNATANLTVTTSPNPLSYSWSGPNSFTSNLVNPSITNIQPIASGVYSTIATYAIGSVSCTTTGTNQISVVPTSTIATTPNFTLCQGSNLNLNSLASGAVSYSWTGPPTYTSGAQNPVVPSMLPTGSGNYSVTASFSLGPLTCTTGAVSNVSVVATPSSTINYSPNICQNATANFSVSAPGAISYSWAGPNSFSSVIAAPSIPNIQTNGSGIYTTTTLFSIGTVTCPTSVTNSVNVVGTNSLAISTNTTVCAGATVNLTSNAASASSYSWSGPASFTSAAQNPTINSILPTGSGNYTATALFIVNNYTCNTTAVTNVSVIPIPPLTVTATNSNICIFQSTTLTANGAVNYTWTPPATLSSINGTTVSANPLVTTVYSVTGADGNGCLKTNTLTLVVNPLPIVTATSNTMCLGTSAVLTASGAVGYTWTPSTSLSNPNIFSVTATPTINTTYTITGSSIKGCINTTTASVIIIPLPVLSITNHTICYGNSTNINVSGAINYTWLPATALSSTNSANVISNPLVPITYTVLGKDLNGCVQSTISTVAVNPLPTISISSPSVICAGQNAIMSASGALTYTWNNTSVAPTITVNPIVSTTYSASGVDANGCINTGTLALTVLIQPTLTITGASTVCLGNALTLTATGGLDYSWNTGSTSNTIAVEPQANNIYTVSSGIAPCNSSTVFAVTVYTPQSQAPYADPPRINYGSSSVINANNLPGHTYGWSFSPDISCNSCQTNIVTPSATTIYTLITRDNNGCIVTNTVLVEVDIICGDAFVPSAFSPNNDGFNDFWCVYGNCITSMNIQLYNRWGEKVFESENKNTCWDGTYNGVMQNDAVFIYQLTAEFVNGEKIVKKGNVTLKR